ncbi:MAG TPA: rRNA maturation RNase YbeY [Phenylobacterium sp.]|nr:rRNA maturation RNase YbeY [Phenylobacterium sp.]
MIDVEVEDSAWTAAVADAEALVRLAAEAALANEGAVGEGVAVLLTDDESVRELNARFRGKDTPTNVLSFPAPPNPERHLGDVALAFGVCAREAAEQGKPLGHHLQHLTVHGVLHLLGFDHIGDDEAEAMEGLERAVLAGLGVPDPYAAG